jgi:hypothetical protein
MSLYIHSGKPLIKKEINDKLSGYFPVAYEELKEDPALELRCGKMSLSLWRTIASFFRLVNKEEKAEAQVRLFYSDIDKHWKAWAFPQEKDTGMTTKELPDHETFQQQMNQMLDNGKYYQWGTCHSHCNAGAFQSGTDKSDEQNSPGIHITMGKIDESEIDLHVRFTVVIPGKLIVNEKGEEDVEKAQVFFCPVKLTDFVEIPEGYIGVNAPKAVRDFTINYLIKQKTEELVDEELVKEWMKNRIEPVKKTFTYSGSSAYSGGSSGGSYSPPSTSAYWEWWESKKSSKKNKKKRKSYSPSHFQTSLSLGAMEKETKEILEPSVDKICGRFSITQMDLCDILSTFDHELDLQKQEILCAVDANILSAWGLSKEKLASTIESWINERQYLAARRYEGDFGYY